MKNLLRGLVGVVIIALGVFVASVLIGLKPEPPVKSPPKAVKLVRTTKAQPQSEMPSTYVQGRVVSLNKIEVFAEVAGVVLPASKEFRAGTRFSKGEPMVRIDSDELRMSLIAQRSGFLQALSSALADIKVDFPDRYEVWRRYTADLNVESKLEALPEPATDREKFFLSNRGILNQYYTIRSAEERLAKYILIAPFSGEVTMSMINTGSLVRVSQKIGEFVSGGGFEIETAVSREDLKVIAKGDSVMFSGDNGKSYVGQVIRIAESIDPSTQTASVFCSVKGDDLQDGIYLSGVIQSQPLDNVIRMPLELLSDDGSVYGVKDDSLLVELNPTVIHRSEKDVLLKDIPAGTVVLSEPISGGYEGMLVKVAK